MFIVLHGKFSHEKGCGRRAQVLIGQSIHFGGNVLCLFAGIGKFGNTCLTRRRVQGGTTSKYNMVLKGPSLKDP